MNAYQHNRYREYVRETPPVNWMTGCDDHQRVEEWQKAIDRPRSNMNDRQYTRPITFSDWLRSISPDEWFGYVYDCTDIPPDKKFIDKRKGIWRCFGPKYGYILVHPSEIKRVYHTCRILCGEILERSSWGGIRWNDLTLSDQGIQLRANTSNGRAILETIWNILEKSESIP